MRMVAELQLPLNVIGVLAGCENMPGGRAYRPGDVRCDIDNRFRLEALNVGQHIAQHQTAFGVGVQHFHRPSHHRPDVEP
jgi:hypothetical protein